MVESRKDLLDWINRVCGLNYSKIEQCGTGAAYCQILDSIYLPLHQTLGDVPLGKVKFEGGLPHDFLQNYKVLQNSFSKHKVPKAVPVDSLLKMKMQDNLDFVQWLKPFWEVNRPDDNYDPKSRRKATPAGLKTTSSRAPSSARTNLESTKPKITKRETPSSVRGPGITGATSRGSQLSNSSISRPASVGKVSSLQREVDELSYQLVFLNTAHETMVQEREFYYQKLRDVELLIQHQISLFPNSAENETIKEIQSILYSTDDGFELPEEEDIEELELPEDVNEVIDGFF